MNKKIKNQKGVISVFAMTAMLFFLLFIIGAYMAISRNNRIQKESNKEVLELYSTDVNAQDIYNDIIAYKGEVIPLYTYDQVENIGSNNFFAIDGKVYCFKSVKKENSSSSYELKSNLILSNDNYGLLDYKRIDRVNNKYVDSDSLKLSLDGINNTGKNHSNKVDKWTNLINTGNTFYDYTIYEGGDNKYTTIKDGEKVISTKWLDNGLSLDGSGDYIKCENILNENDNAFTYEIVFKTNSTSKNQNLIRNGNNGGGGLTYTEGNLYGEVALPNNVKRKVSTNCGIKENSITHVAMTFNGQKICLYKNGKKIADDSENTMKKASTETIEYKTLPTEVYNSDDYKVEMGMHSYIGKENEKSANGITILPYFSRDDGYSYPTYRMDQGGKVNPSYYILADNPRESGSNFYRDFSSLISSGIINKEKELKFHVGLNVTPMSGLKTLDLDFDNVKIGSSDTESSFSIIANGSDSVVIRSNIGKIQNWYFNDEKKLTSSKNGEVEILGTYYYCFDGLDPDTIYNIRGEFSTDIISPKIVGDELPNIYIGNSYDNKFNGKSGASLNGVVYAVRVYDKALSSDKIKTNYQIDKNRFSIKD